VVLRQKFAPTARFIALLVAAVFWNLISGVAFYFTLEEFRSGGAGIFVVLLVSLFPLVGLGFIAATIFSFLALFNPKPDLTIDRAQLPPGAETRLHWRFSGATTRLVSLTITLTGCESARYRRGTSTYTEKHVFYKKQLFFSLNRSAIQSGSVSAAIPAGYMPSFKAPNNEIIWQITMEGKIPNWPDLRAEFPLTVIPEPRHSA
jgi:hypothetical protein